MYEEPNDASSDPNADDHLPTAGEFGTRHVPLNGTAIDENGEEIDNIDDPNDMNEISSKSTDQIALAPDTDGPADPMATGDKSY